MKDLGGNRSLFRKPAWLTKQIVAPDGWEFGIEGLVLTARFIAEGRPFAATASWP